MGMFAQELSFTHPELRSLCQDKLARIAKDFATDLAEAKRFMHPELLSIPKASRCCISHRARLAPAGQGLEATACWSRTSNNFALASRFCSADAAVPPENTRQSSVESRN